MLRDWTDSEKMMELSAQAERFFVRLIMKADDYGCYYADTRLLRASMFPLLLDTIREADITRWMAECQKAGLIVLYEVAGKKYLQIKEFNQRLRARKSRFPMPEGEIEDDGVGYVYFISNGVDNKIKIGFSLNPWARAKELSTGNPKKLSVLFTFRGSKKDEKEMQSVLQPFRLHKEWFKLPDHITEILSRLNDEKTEAYNIINILRSSDVVLRSTPEVEVEVEEETEEEDIDRRAKPPSIEERDRFFYDELKAYVGTYGKEMLRAFYDYWREPNKSRTKMRYEQERTWDLNLRLQRWAANEKSREKKPEVRTENYLPDARELAKKYV